MTRFLMSLADSVDLVKHAFEHAEPGDLFVRKAPATTVATLATAVGGSSARTSPRSTTSAPATARSCTRRC